MCRHKQSGKWAARLQSRGQKVFLGLFDTEEEAAAAFESEAQRLGLPVVTQVPDLLGEVPITPRASSRRTTPSVKSRLSAAAAADDADPTWHPYGGGKAHVMTVSSAAAPWDDDVDVQMMSPEEAAATLMHIASCARATLARHGIAG